MIRTLFIRAISCLLIAGLLPMAAADTYTIDASHSEVAFRIRHLVSKVPGRFTKFQGSIQVDEKDLSKSSVEVTIDAASINTDNEARDKHLRNADFFDVANFPTITFRSTAVKEVAKGKLEVTGDFTLHGVTKRITLPVSVLGVMKSPFNDVRGGFEGSARFDRNDYGIKTYPGVLGDEIEVTLNIEAVKAAPKP